MRESIYSAKRPDDWGQMIEGFETILPRWVEAYPMIHKDGKPGVGFMFCGKYGTCVLEKPWVELSNLKQRKTLRDGMEQFMVVLTMGDEAKPYRKALKVFWCRRSEELINEIKRIAANARPPHSSSPQGGQEPAAGHSPSGTA